MNNCVFCKIVKGELPYYKVWEDENHLAFLSIMPQIEGMAIVIPKEHFPSYFANVDKDVVSKLLEASQSVAKLLDTKLENVRRTKLVLEGLEIDHLHAKLYPIYSDGKTAGAPKKASPDKLQKVLDKILG
jgi:diadenosine tetraphosphate (Ap4A) HIT family hydrolase